MMKILMRKETVHPDQSCTCVQTFRRKTEAGRIQMLNTTRRWTNSQEGVFFVWDISDHRYSSLHNLLKICHELCFIKFTEFISNKTMRNILYRERRKFFQVTKKNGTIIKCIEVRSGEGIFGFINRIQTCGDRRPLWIVLNR